MAAEARGRGGLIAAVARDSIGHEIGLEPGDRLLAINGHPLRDVLDYRYHADEPVLVLEVERGGRVHRLEVERDEDESLGLSFAEALFDDVRTCNNHCPFCFVQQLPPGLRPALYLRDDDYRLSFLHGSYVTLTNLGEEDWQRIGAQRLSPLYVSVHATDAAVRARLLGRRRAPDILAQLRRLGRMGIAVHAQVVLVPGINDGTVLDATIGDLLALWPTVRTLALVPLGLTRYHRGGLRLLQASEAATVLRQARRWRPRVRRHTGRTWLYPADELFLAAGRPIPGRAFYDDPAQLENGVGLVRALKDDWARLRRRLRREPGRGRGRATLACGTLIAPLLAGMAAELSELSGLDAAVAPIENRLLGASVTVSGLLAGGDLVRALQGRDLGERLFVPRSMLDAEGRVTLDDLTLGDLSAQLGVPVTPASRLSEVWAAMRR